VFSRFEVFCLNLKLDMIDFDRLNFPKENCASKLDLFPTSFKFIVKPQAK